MRNPPNAVKRTQAFILARLGRLEESRRFAAEFLQGKPDYNFEEFMKSRHFKDDTYRDKLAEDLRKAGLSEKRL
jgi:phosphoserine phosphatase